MNRILLAAAFLAVPVVHASSAVIPLYEPFDYAVGTKLGGTSASPDAGIHTWARTGPTIVIDDEATATAGNLAVPALLPAPQGGKALYGGQGHTDRINLNAVGDPTNSGTVYYSLALTVTNTGNVTGQTGAIGQVAVGMNNSTGAQAGNPSVHAADIWVQPGTTAGTYRLGLSQTAATSTRVFEAGEHALGETVFIVASYEFVAGGATNDVAKLWINPTTLGVDEGSLPAPTLTASGAAADIGQITSFFLYQTGNALITNSATLGEDGVQADELRVDTTYAGVTPIPEPASLALLGLSAAGVMARRRRA